MGKPPLLSHCVLVGFETVAVSDLGSIGAPAVTPGVGEGVATAAVGKAPGAAAAGVGAVAGADAVAAGGTGVASATGVEPVVGVRPLPGSSAGGFAGGRPPLADAAARRWLGSS